MKIDVATAKLGSEIGKIERFTTLISNRIRHWIWLNKTTDTHPDYPREIGLLTQKPL